MKEEGEMARKKERERMPIRCNQMGAKKDKRGECPSGTGFEQSQPLNMSVPPRPPHRPYMGGPPASYRFLVCSGFHRSFSMRSILQRMPLLGVNRCGGGGGCLLVCTLCITTYKTCSRKIQKKNIRKYPSTNK